MFGFDLHTVLYCSMSSDSPLQAVWTRFFPASVEISRLLSQKEVGEVKVVHADFGVPLMDVVRAVQKELGGGALLDIGIYCLQFVLMVFNGEKPECVQATGFCLDTGTELTPVWRSHANKQDIILYAYIYILYSTFHT